MLVNFSYVLARNIWNTALTLSNYKRSCNLSVFKSTTFDKISLQVYWTDETGVISSIHERLVYLNKLAKAFYADLVTLLLRINLGFSFELVCFIIKNVKVCSYFSLQNTAIFDNLVCIGVNNSESKEERGLYGIILYFWLFCDKSWYSSLWDLSIRNHSQNIVDSET